MTIQVTIGNGTGHKAECVEAASTYEGLMQYLHDPVLAAKLKAMRFAHFVVIVGPHDPMPGRVSCQTRMEGAHAA